MSETQTATVNSIEFAAAGTVEVAFPLVLIADLDGASRARRADQMRARGFRIALARTSFETIVKASCLMPDLIVMDSSVAEAAGETAELIANCPSTAHIPIFRLSAGRRIPLRVLTRARC